MIKIINMLFYGIYNFILLLQRFFNYPVIFFLKRRAISNFYNEKGVINPVAEVLKATNSPINGTAILIANIHMLILFGFLVVGSFGFVFHLFGLELYFSLLHILIISSLAFLCDYFSISKNNVYLSYFKSFDALSMTKKVINYVASMVIFVLIWVYGLWGLVFLGSIKSHPERWGLFPIIG